MGHLAQQTKAQNKKDKTPRKQMEFARRVVDIVRDVAVELHPGKRHVDVALDSDLDRDLGFDSLGRAELILRINRAFKVELAEDLLAEARTPDDLLQAVLKEGPASVPALKTIRKRPAKTVAEPRTAQTLLDVLAFHVRNHRERTHIILTHGKDKDEQITYGMLDKAARAVARGVLDQGRNAGDRIAIMLPTGADFFTAFFGILYAGCVPVPIYPPTRLSQVEDHLRRQGGILRNAQTSLLITDSKIRPLGAFLRGLVPDLKAVETVEELSRGGELEQLVKTAPGSTALIQYTSGSTGDPKGVVLSHANLLANIRAMGAAMNASSRDVFVSWLPLYHDMGLIGAWLGSLYYGAEAIIMSPFAFLATPARWLRTIHNYRATLSAAPNFAFELCLKNITDEDIEGLDLSSLRMVANGAEPVSPDTITRFIDRFEKYGFKPGAMAPVYGLAEASVGLAFPPPDRAPIIDRVRRDTMSRHGKAAPADPADASALQFVTSGSPLPGHEVRIVDPAYHEVPDRQEGRLEFRGPSTTKGYFRNEVKTKDLIRDGWLDSGDKAYIADGEIYITDRIKDIIIRAGRNIYPHELEEHVGNVPGVRKGCVAAFPDKAQGGAVERLVVLAETRETEAQKLENIRAAIVDASLDLLNMPPDEVVMVPPHTVPKTSSGKIRRAAAGALYRSGVLIRPAKALWWQLTRLSLATATGRVFGLWRRAVEYGYGAFWWLTVVLLALILWPVVLILPKRSWRYATIRGFAKVFLRLMGLSLDISGAVGVPERRVIMVSNHASYLDSLVLLAVFPGEFSFVAKQELAPQIIAGPFLRRLGTLFVRRVDPKGGIADLAATMDAARRGERIVTFPEGGISRRPGLMEFRLGAFELAAKTGLEVVPVTITGTRSILRGGTWFPRRGSIAVHIGKPVKAKGNDFSAAVTVRDRVRSEILAHCGEPDLAGMP